MQVFFREARGHERALHALRELNRSMAGIVVTNKAADKPNDDTGHGNVRPRYRRTFSSPGCGHASKRHALSRQDQRRRKDDEDAEWSD